MKKKEGITRKDINLPDFYIDIIKGLANKKGWSVKKYMEWIIVQTAKKAAPATESPNKLSSKK